MWRQFGQFCATNGLATPHPTAAAVLAFLGWRRSRVSGRTVAKDVSKLIKACEQRDLSVAWAQEYYSVVRKAATGARKSDPSVPVRAAAIRACDLRIARRRLSVANPDHLHFWCQLLVAQQGMLRVCEHAGGAIVAGDFELDNRSRVLSLLLRSNKNDPGNSRGPHYVFYPFRCHEPDSCVHCLLTRACRLGAFGGRVVRDLDALPADLQLFPASARSFNSSLKSLLEVSEFPCPRGHRVSSHGLRAGGLLDARAAKVPVEEIRRQGRWGPSAWLVYARGESRAAEEQWRRAFDVVPGAKRIDAE